MRVEHIDQSALEKHIVDVVQKFISLSEYKLLFFGSRVKEEGDETSDIDVGVIGKNPIGIRTVGKIKSALEDISVLYKIDFVDLSVAASDFKKSVLNDGNIEYFKISQEKK